MLVLIVIGDTDLEKNGIVSGQMVSQLSKEAREDFRDTVDSLRGYKFDNIFCSDLEAGQDCARIWTNRIGSKISFREELRERCLGIFEGVSLKELRAKLSPRHYRLWERDYYETPEFGESLDDLEDKVRPFIVNEMVPLIAAKKNILIISHHDVIRVMIGIIRKDSEEDIQKTKLEKSTPYFFYNL